MLPHLITYFVLFVQMLLLLIVYFAFTELVYELDDLCICMEFGTAGSLTS